MMLLWKEFTTTISHLLETYCSALARPLSLQKSRQNTHQVGLDSEKARDFST